ncbi:MAG: dihydrodipicolinate synthase family protein, partial [Planctomycetaceae bacterium]|nr:dihydrodipicolinate synthase family protein [Planctomycetaceae bacterium]
MSLTLSGVMPILHTPFDGNDDIDPDSLLKQIDWAVALGVNGVCSAMVSEILRLTASERLALNRMIVEMTAGRASVVCSVGAESTRQAIEFAVDAEQGGCHAVMAIPPVTCALPETALWEYFDQLARAVDIPVIVQDASSYVGRSIPTSFYVRLLDEFGP